MELKDKQQLKSEILQAWVKAAWVYPMRDDDGRTYLRLTPGGRLKMRRRIGELEASSGMQGSEALKQEEADTLPAERDKLELALMVEAYTSERRFIESQGMSLGTAAVTVEEAPAEAQTEGTAGAPEPPEA